MNICHSELDCIWSIHLCSIYRTSLITEIIHWITFPEKGAFSYSWEEMLCTMQWTPFAEICKLLLCAFVNWLGFSLTLLIRPLWKEPSRGTVFPQASSGWCWSGAYLHGMGSSSWVCSLELDPSDRQSVCPCCLQSWCTSGLWCLCLCWFICTLGCFSESRFEIGLVLVFCVLQSNSHIA